jgi:hypothetical protein
MINELRNAMTENRKKYDASLEVFRAAARAFFEVQRAYRAREIGDDVFAAGRRAYIAAQEAADVAEAEFVAAARSADE